MTLQTAAVFMLLLCSTHTLYLQDTDTEDSSGNSIEDDEFSVSTLLEKANANVGKNAGDPLLMFGDIPIPRGLQNADPCTSRGCLWTKASDGKVYVPYQISKQFPPKDKNRLLRGLRSFSKDTCIRFTQHKGETDFINIKSLSGCYSDVGRQGGGQDVSLDRKGCLTLSLIQHELLHVLGFDHEQSRSDRDQHIQILLKNVIPENKPDFVLIQTNNLGTPYDYNSIMQYGRYAFSKNKQPTLIPFPNPKVPIGKATKMSTNDILRINLLYSCSSPGVRP